MANKKAKKTTKSSANNDDNNVVRIKASSPVSAAKKERAVEAEVTKVTSKSNNKIEKSTKTTGEKEKAPHKQKKRRWLRRTLGATGGYFKGAWVELRQVRWPNRRATWSLTAAVLIYTAFFVALILLLDAGFQYLFDLILGN